MDLCDRNQIKDLLARHGITLAKTYGQHFLVDRKVLEAIVAASFPPPAEARAKEGARPACRQAGVLLKPATVIEVGPGAGTLTVELAKHAGQVIAIEHDPRFLPVLGETLAGSRNVRVIEADALKAPFFSLVPRSSSEGGRTSYDIVSNLPYEITTPFLWKVLFEEKEKPGQVTLLLQAEVVLRILAKPPRMNLLALLVAFFGEPRLVRRVPAAAFFPPPRVESAILRIEASSQPDPHSHSGGGLPVASRAALALARRAFAHPRRKLRTTLGEQAGRFADRRPGELSPADWLSLVRASQA